MVLMAHQGRLAHKDRRAHRAILEIPEPLALQARLDRQVKTGKMAQKDHRGQRVPPGPQAPKDLLETRAPKDHKAHWARPDRTGRMAQKDHRGQRVLLALPDLLVLRGRLALPEPTVGGWKTM